MRNPATHRKALEISFLSILPSGQLMEQLASDTCTNRRVTCVLDRIGWRRGVLEVCQLESQIVCRNKAGNYQTD